MARKLNLSYQDIEASLEVFKNKQVVASEVGYEILKAFGKSEAEIRRYREGKGILSTYNGLLIKGLFGFKTASKTNLISTLEEMKADVKVIKAAPKLVAVSDGDSIIAYDMRERETYEKLLNRVYCDFDFFYPLCGVEHFKSVDESPADVKAAEKLAKLHDEIRAYNEFNSKSELHDLNIFIARLLFCFFAEDTGIFEKNLFTSSITRYTKDDGSNIAEYLNDAFNIMDIKMRNADTIKIISQFPYVNGGLFAKHIQIPKMGYKARKIILECGELDWENINPDIFGSMIQAVVDPEIRANQGMHYTSVPNIMKVINPLFMDELRGEYDKMFNEYRQNKQLIEMGALTERDFSSKCQSIVKKSNELLKRMSKMKFFDPACGSGNFLIITYKSLRFLEMDILELQKLCDRETQIGAVMGTCIHLDQFYGIELLDFPHEIAMLSLWLAQHQMDNKLFETFNINTQALPLHNITQIVCGNACRLDWNVVCPHEKDDEVFVFGNPPYLGARNQSIEQKEDMKVVFKDLQFGMLDYVVCWFFKAAYYISKSVSVLCAFVSTNSITQGIQISAMWKPLFNNDIDIIFAYQSFKWDNNAKSKAGVTCVIIGIGDKSVKRPRLLYTNTNTLKLKSISPSLSTTPFSIVYPTNKNMNGFKPMLKGSLPADDNYLTLYDNDLKILSSKYSEIFMLIKPFIGSQEMLRRENRYCIWINDSNVDLAYEIPEFVNRFECVKKMRLGSKKKNTRDLSSRPYTFTENRFRKPSGLIIPVVSSEKREYIPMAFFKPDTVIYYSAFAIYDAETWLFGILESKMHMAWVRTVGGKLKTDYRYSAQLCYNTFPFPKITDEKRAELTTAAEEILVTRGGYPLKTLAEMYAPDKMPQDLREAHNTLDNIVDSCYSGYPFANDEARLECLFRMYEKMTTKN